MYLCRCRAEEPDNRPPGVLTKDDFIQLGKKIAEAAVLQVQGISEQDRKRLSRDMRKILKKVKKQDKKWFKQAKKSIQLFMVNGSTEGILESLKTFKEKYS